MGDFFSDFRECPCAAVDTAYALTQQGALTPGAFIVPKGASRITAIKIFVSGIVTDVVTGTTTAIELRGIGGDQWYVGPMCSQSGAAATSGGFDFRDGMVYQTNIDVSRISQFDAFAYLNGEDMGTGHILLAIEYDGIPGRIRESDYREIDIGAAANTLVAVVDRGVTAAQGNFKPNGRTICEVVFGAALDPTGDAANGLVFAPAMELSGNGLLTGGPYKFLGPAGPTQPDTDVAGNQSVIVNPSRVIPGSGIRTQNGDVVASAQNIESINPGHAIVGICYA